MFVVPDQKRSQDATREVVPRELQSEFNLILRSCTLNLDKSTGGSVLDVLWLCLGKLLVLHPNRLDKGLRKFGDGFLNPLESL